LADRSSSELTRILETVAHGGEDAVDRLLPLVYRELRVLAERSLRHERQDHTLGATALVHEAYLKLVDQKNVKWQSRAHFLAIAAQAIRRILVDHARTKKREKRGGGRQRIPLSAVFPTMPVGRNLDLLALEEAMERLAREEPVESRVVEMRFFGGMTINEVAEVLGISDRTVRRRWSYAKAWLYREVTKGDTRTQGEPQP